MMVASGAPQEGSISLATFRYSVVREALQESGLRRRSRRPSIGTEFATPRSTGRVTYWRLATSRFQLTKIDEPGPANPRPDASTR